MCVCMYAVCIIRTLYSRLDCYCNNAPLAAVVVKVVTHFIFVTDVVAVKFQTVKVIIQVLIAMVIAAGNCGQ